VADVAKIQGWMIPFEFLRLAYSNEISIDPKGGSCLDGNQLKRFSSGGDWLTARLLHQNIISFRVQSHMLLMCNDVPPSKPADANETAIKFEMPSKFVSPDDPRVAERVPIGSKKIAFWPADEGVKDLCRSDAMIDSFALAVIAAYKPHKVCIPACMADTVEEFKGGDEDEYALFHQMFEFTGNHSDSIPKMDIKEKIEAAGLAITSQRYNRYLLAAGCEMHRVNGKRCATGLRFDDPDALPDISFENAI
jgi:hypothetical protein